VPIFKIHAGKLKKLHTVPLGKEKSLQALLEANLQEVLELQFLATEYTTTFGGRIDTLAVDSGGAPVIIEYKRNKNDNVINQSLSYLKWLKTQKPGFFEKLMIDKLGQQAANHIKLDWGNPRVICIAESYSKFDIDTAEVVPLRIELMRYRYYEDGVFALEPINLPEEPSIVSAPVKDTAEKAEISEPGSADGLLSKATLATRELFEQLREKVRAMDDAIVEKATAFYVAFRVSNNFAEVHIGKNQLKIHLRPIDYADPKGLVDKIPEGYNWTMDRRIYLKGPEDLDYVVGIIEQSYKNVL
jgi:predicted transport protein